MREVFADSFYYIAMLSPRDQHHLDAWAVFLNLRSSARIVTSRWVLIEVADALASPATRRRTHRFLRDIANDPKTAVISDMDPWYERGVALYGSRLDKNWSLTDCISFEIMSERRIDEALTGDQHFLQAGFRPLLRPTN
jgi:predicted nucleic acid-binding protein